MDNANLNPLLINSGERQFWIKPWGHPDFSPDEGEQVFDDPAITVWFARAPRSVRVGDIIIVYRIKVKKIMFICEAVGSLYYASAEELQKYPHLTRWPWRIDTRNLTLTFGTQWAKYSLSPYTLADEYNQQHPQDKITLGGLKFGSDKLRISEGFGKFLIKEILRLT
jgi:hypothetical protein